MKVSKPSKYYYIEKKIGTQNLLRVWPVCGGLPAQGGPGAGVWGGAPRRGMGADAPIPHLQNE